MMSESAGAEPDDATTNAFSDKPNPDAADADNDADADQPSSSTEGPDSPGQSSAASSPIPPMAMPNSTAHFGAAAALTAADNGGASGVPVFQIAFTDEVTKDADAVRYRLKVRRLAPENADARPQLIERQYEDFEYLHHNLTTQNNMAGVIVPPLPARPAADPQSAEARAKKQLGSASRQIQADDFQADIFYLDKYMQALLVHPLFGRDKHLEEFLQHSNPPIRAKIRRGFMSGWRQTLDSRKQASTKDEDETFQKERDWAGQYGGQIKEVCDRFQGVISSQLQLANQINHLATVLGGSVGGQDGATAFYNRLNSRFASGLEEERRGLEVVARNEDKTMGAYLNRWTAYMEEENAMLLRRTLLMLEKEAAAKALAKAKPAKAEPLRLAKEEKERDFDACSDMARGEVKRFHQSRLMEMRDTLVQYTEGQIRCARDAYDDLAKCVVKLRDFPLPQMGEAEKAAESQE